MSDLPVLNVGDADVLSFTHEDSDGNAIDIANYTIKWALSKTPQDDAKLTKETGGSGISITDSSAGKYDVTIDNGDTTGFGGRVYYHEVELTDGNGDKTTGFSDWIKVERDAIE